MRCPKCGEPMAFLAEPPSANGFEFALYGCTACRFKEMRCLCVASGRSGNEEIFDEDAAIILGGRHPNLKAFMKAWQVRVIGA